MTAICGARTLSFYVFYRIILSSSFGSSVRIPFINNAVLIDLDSSNTTMVLDRSCDQCLCLSILSYAAVNCLSNGTCQFFRTFPYRYRIEMKSQARLYFPQQSFPNVSECCMSNLTDLLNRLKQGNLISVNVSTPRDLVLDNRGALVTVEMSGSHLNRFNAMNLSRLDLLFLTSSSIRVIALDHNIYYVALNNNSMLLIDAGNLTVLPGLTLANVNGPRGVIFLNDGQTMVVSSIQNDSLVFFNRSSIIPPAYTFQFRQSVNCSSPHGLRRVNDSLFYATSYSKNLIYSYRRTNGSTTWQEQFVFSVPKVNSTFGAIHLTIDECNRIWLSLETDTVIIFDQQGNPLGNFTILNAAIYDVYIGENYLMYFSDRKSNRIIRLDPNIQC